MEAAMPVQLTPNQIALLKEPHLAQFVTLRKDGSPHIAPVWVDTDGRHVIVNTAEGRVKVRNIRQDPRVAIAVYDPKNSYSRVLNIEGRVIEVTKEGAEDHIDAMHMKYRGTPRYPAHDPAHPRLIVRIQPERIYGRI
jgi:PPOX class probable F420-dependent enzyme